MFVAKKKETTQIHEKFNIVCVIAGLVFFFYSKNETSVPNHFAKLLKCVLWHIFLVCQKICLMTSEVMQFMGNKCFNRGPCDFLWQNMTGQSI